MMFGSSYCSTNADLTAGFLVELVCTLRRPLLLMCGWLL